MDNGASSYHRFLNGDERGFVEIVKDYSQSLLYFINGFVSNITIAEDLMEDVFVDLIVYKNRFKGQSSFKTFIFAMARNKAVDYIRKHKHVNPLEDVALLEDITELEDAVLKAEKNKILAKALRNIKSEHKTVLTLLYFEDMSYDDIAKILKKNNKQIKNMAYSARRALKAALEKEGFTDENL